MERQFEPKISLNPVLLYREIRFAVVSPDQRLERRLTNSWAGWPVTNRIAPHLVLGCEIEGKPEAATGYLCNIRVIDDALRSIVTRTLIPEADRLPTAETMIQAVYHELLENWNHHSIIASIQLSLSPYLRYAIVAEDNMNQTSNPQIRVRLTEQFEFSAAHRLHCESMSADENARLFGKCNNPSGHGHNYVVEITLSNQVADQNDSVIELARFESIVKRLVIDQLDHKHLNHDIQYFDRVNPTVENITLAIFDWLAGQFGDAQLEKVRVYETPKTWAEVAR